ncbi:MAG: GlsB/YeaQ/YmgE family stress response membrane protein [Thermoanaerobaculia bacterium]
MGTGMWVIAGIGAFSVARLIRAGRPAGWVLEASAGVLTASAAGLAATALDFGGWQEPDWRAGAFALAVSLAAIGLTRVARLVRR